MASQADINLPYTVVSQWLQYLPSTGQFIARKSNRNGSIRKGLPVGSVAKDGYVYITLLGYKQKAHRLAYLLQTGDYPSDNIDHLDHNRSNNAWYNIVLKNHADNSKNLSNQVSSNTGYQGVWFDKKRNKFISYINMGGKRVWQKTFNTADHAHNERCEQLMLLGFDPNHGK